MKQKNPLLDVVQAQKAGYPKGVYSICSSNPFVIEACMKKALQDNSLVLIESTSNQVNQFGGYTGMNAAQFSVFVKKIAEKMKFPWENVLLGGDHLGPNVWTQELSALAMQKSCELVYSSVQAGYSKIHLDASMKCADDATDKSLDLELSAERAALMCKAAEDAYQAKPITQWAPCYIIGTEVPVPGGALIGETEITITTPADAEKTIDVTRRAFFRLGLQDAWERVVALVVQPGVEFGDSSLHHYNREKAKPLSKFIESSEHLIYEAHSTDYQTTKSLKEMVEDHFAILKVGPALTFSFREAVFALEMMEKELLSGDKGVSLSGMDSVLEEAMQENPKHWVRHYSGDEGQLRFARKYSFSDRSRYYWTVEKVQNSLAILLSNLNLNPIPLSLLSQYLPIQYKKVCSGELKNEPLELIYDKIIDLVSDYSYACA